MNLRYDIFADDFFVGDQTLREFYVEARKKAGVSTATLERLAGVMRPTFYNLEYTNKKGYRSNSVRAMLIALEELGYSLEIEK